MLLGVSFDTHWAMGFAVLKMDDKILKQSAPDSLTMAMAPIPFGDAMAQMLSC
jgi:hypothetical protein